MKHFLPLSLLLVLVCLLSGSSYAQEAVTVTGTVASETGETLPGVTVLEKGTTNGTITDIDGNYAIQVSPDAVLTFNYIGFANQEVPVNNQSTVDVVMQMEDTQLEEVVVTALGVERSEKSLTYARQGVDTDDLKEARTSNFIQSLSGKAAGVQVQNAQTATGSNRVIIRGITSVNGDNAPLYVIDGVPLDKTVGDQAQRNGAWGNVNNYSPLDYGDPVSNLNPDDIENIEILKGPNASALYGSRAANGVILITTKRGSKKDGLGITVNSNFMFNEVNQWPDYQYLYGSGTLGNIISDNNFDPQTGLPRVNVPQAFGSPLLGFDVIDFNGEVGPYLARPNNIRDLYRTGLTATNGIAFESGSDNYDLRVGYTNTNSRWMMDNLERVNRHNLSLRLGSNLSDKIRVESTLLYTKDEVKNRVVENGSALNPAQNYIYMHPNMYSGNLLPYKDANGRVLPQGGLAGGDGFITNPYWTLYENSNQDNTDRVIGNVALIVKPVEGLSVRLKANSDVRLIEGEAFQNSGNVTNPDGRYQTINRSIQNWNFEVLNTYDRTWNDLSLVATLGGNQFVYDFSSRQAVVDRLFIPDVKSLSNNDDIVSVTEADARRIINSVFGSSSLGYRGTFFLDLSLRRDWSSTLPAGENAYDYPSVGGSVIVTELLPQSDLISFGKLRASWAKVGSDAGFNQLLTPFFASSTPYNGTTLLTLGNTRGNPTLTPEFTTSQEYGLETILFNNRIKANVTYYKSLSTNQIMVAEVPRPTGFVNAIVNAGEISNEGWEVYVNANVINRPFNWDIDLNWSTNETFVESLAEGVPSLTLAVWAGQTVQVRAEEGKPFGVIRGVGYARDPETNAILINEENGEHYPENNVELGNFQPDWIGSIRNSFSYKGFNLNFLLDIKAGGDLWSGSANRQSQFGTSESTLFGRDDWMFSERILGENADERAGRGFYGNPYPDDDRPKGAIFDGEIAREVDPDGDGNGVLVSTGIPNYIYISPNSYHFHFDNIEEDVYDASYVKLREVVLGYTLPSKIVNATPFTSVRLSLVGRNLAILHQNTPQGIDPESGYSSGNGQGLEFGAFLPSRSYGFNLNLSF